MSFYTYMGHKRISYRSADQPDLFVFVLYTSSRNLHKEFFIKRSTHSTFETFHTMCRSLSLCVRKELPVAGPVDHLQCFQKHSDNDRITQRTIPLIPSLAMAVQITIPTQKPSHITVNITALFLYLVPAAAVRLSRNTPLFFIRYQKYSSYTISNRLYCSRKN